jgi:D-amino-acid dehydrogenase
MTDLVAGAGGVGVCAAAALARRGRDVLVVDRGAPASGCSGGNAGLVVPSHSLPMASPGAVAQGLRGLFDPDGPFAIRFRWSWSLWSWLWRFRAACTETRARRAAPLLRDLHLESAGLFERLAGPGGVECGFARRGLLLVYRTTAGLHEGLEEAKVLEGFGLESRPLDPGPARDLVPGLKTGLAGAIHYPADAHLDPRAFVEGMARRSGARFREGVEILGARGEGRRLRALVTSQGEIEADEFVLATGAWTPRLARELGLSLPMEAAKGYSVTLKAPSAPPTLPLLLMEARVAVTPLGAALRLAGTLELAGPDLSINERRVEAVRRGAREALEGLEGLPELEVWRGWRPCTPDGLPYLGRPRRWDNLVVAAGHAMIGLSLAPVSGELVARLVTGEDPGHDLSLLSPDRYA